MREFGGQNQSTCEHSRLYAWCGISKYKIIGPFEIEDSNAIGDSCQNFLIRKVFLRLQLLLSDFVFQQDGLALGKSARVRP